MIAKTLGHYQITSELGKGGMGVLGIIRSCLQRGDSAGSLRAGEEKRWGARNRRCYFRGHRGRRGGELSSADTERTNTHTYRPMQVRKKAIPKKGSTKVRILSIPSIRDRVVQGALKLLLEPIFETSA